MKYYLPDSQDLVDPSFNFQKETRNPDRVRHRDDRYAHEVFGQRVFDGILVSKAAVDSVGGGSARYTGPQRRRFDRLGVKQFFRASNHAWGKLRFMGDCGAFSYVKDDVPPYSVDEVIDFYVRGRFDLGVSVDHVILDYEPKWDLRVNGRSAVPPEIKARQKITLQLARKFLDTCERQSVGFTPVGVAQGWSPKSYAAAVASLQKMGYEYIAIGGVVPLKTEKLVQVLQTIDDIRNPSTKLHLLGVTRLERIADFRNFGVVSFDSTSPLRRAWMDNKVNYFTLDDAYTALRVPQVDGNVSLQKAIRAGVIKHDLAHAAEQKCLRLLEEYDQGRRTTKSVLQALLDYEAIHSPEGDRRDAYERMLVDRPWKLCKCEVCSQLGHHVAMFRGAERNRRRGFHNVHVFYDRLKLGLGKPKSSLATLREPEQQMLHL
ncbi:tRNA-guanine transglycosylase DpdA [Nannocystaceae bacterium ST9]